MKYDIDGSGEREYIASVYTMMLYEQEFHTSLLEDVYGKIDLGNTAEDGSGAKIVTAEFVQDRLASALPDGKELPNTTVKLIKKAFPTVVTTALDFTKDNWDAYLRCMWTMAKTADEVEKSRVTPNYKEWLMSLGPVNLNGISNFVWKETRRGLFRAASDSNKTDDGDEPEK